MIESEFDGHHKVIPPHDNTVSGVQPLALVELWEELLVKEGTCWGKVISDSMLPVIGQGDQVLVERALSNNIRFGDIIVFRKNGQLVVHRVLAKRKLNGECHILEKGDAMFQSNLIPAQDILGRVTVVSRHGKSLRTVSGSGRILQLLLACISYTSLWLRVVLESCLAIGRRARKGHGYSVTYNNAFSWLRRVMLRLFIKARK